ncbi:MAG TPA: DUF4058 family protein [Humisphaera sp.]|nr:DUF4058 family protein [Humisphaera sp.]
MPIHDWSRVDAGIFHDFHQAWTIEIRNALNGGALPAGYFALADQIVSGPIPDVVTLQRRKPLGTESRISGGLAVAEVAPTARFVSSAHADPYARKANRIAIRHKLGRVVAVIEIVSPGNKSGQSAFGSFVAKAEEMLLNGINLVVVDLFPPSARDPQGIHKAIWDRIQDEPFELPADKQLTVAAYFAGEPKMAYVEPVAVGDMLPSLPIFLDENTYVPAPLEATYQSTWAKLPDVVREFVLTGIA